MPAVRFPSEQSINGVKIKRLAYGGGEKITLSDKDESTVTPLGLN
jgi:hypothetical protein